MIFVRADQCPSCGGPTLVLYRGLRDRFETSADQEFELDRCQVCRLTFTNPLPEGNVARLYPKHYFAQKEMGTVSRLSLERWYRYDQYRFDFRLVEAATGMKVADYASYLDIGSGSGDRVAFVHSKGVSRAHGLEPFGSYEGATQGKTIFTQSVDSFRPKRRYAVVSLFHVLEHVPDPTALLRHVRQQLLTDNGWLILQVPNAGSLERYFFGRSWFGFDVPRHLWHFESTTIRSLLDIAGYEVVSDYRNNALLHPVTFVPSLHRDLDISRIVVSGNGGSKYWFLMKIVWILLTVLSIPVSWLLSRFRSGTMLTVIARKK